MFVHCYYNIFTSDSKIYFWGFISTLPFFFGMRQKTGCRVSCPDSFHKNIQYYEQAHPSGSPGRLAGVSPGRNVV
jgi:hypothetical protein